MSEGLALGACPGCAAENRLAEKAFRLGPRTRQPYPSQKDTRLCEHASYTIGYFGWNSLLWQILLLKCLGMPRFPT
jgi:hypothetical protein